MEPSHKIILTYKDKILAALQAAALLEAPVTHRRSQDPYTAKKMKFSIKDFLGKCDQIRSMLKKFLMENFICCTLL